MPVAARNELVIYRAKGHAPKCHRVVNCLFKSAIAWHLPETASMTKSNSNSEQASRFIIGIDLGTTNSAVTWVDTEANPWKVQLFQVPQWVDAQTMEAIDTLPSFHYQPIDSERPSAAPRPWDPEGEQAYIVGVYAREQGSVVPSRFISSAKSWLSQSRMDRTAAILPWHGAKDLRKISPVEVSARYLAHIRNCWNHVHPRHHMEDQDVMVTVPASFDEVARELTIEAAQRCGLNRLVLLEEPQAAFYAWMQQEDQTPLNPEDRVLVIDIGGGTTDLTLIAVKEDGNFQRVAVGDHLILGGDNLDYALALLCESKLDQKLNAHQWNVLLRKARAAKEQLMGSRSPEAVTVTIPGRGSRLIGGAISIELQRDEAERLFLSNYLPLVEFNDRPATAEAPPPETGLVYAPDNGITRYLAQFISNHGRRVDAVLLNGGFFESPVFSKRMLDQLTAWFGSAPRLLENRHSGVQRLDLAVAIGASAYGMVRRGEGRAIEAGLARSYYMGVTDETGETRALCLAPAGLAEGERVVMERQFTLAIRQPVQFPIFVSSTRTTDSPGDLLPVQESDLTSLPPIRTVLQAGRKAKSRQVNVQLEVGLTPIGTLELYCVETDGDRRWRLNFDVRSTVQTDVRAHEGEAEQAGLVDEAAITTADETLRACFASPSTISPDALVRRLESAVDLPREDWPPSLIRPMWETILKLESGRQHGPQMEARWLNLLGYCLRPGRGFAADDWRVDRTWRIFHNHVVHAKNGMCRAEWWILWRRLAAGISAGRQAELAGPLIASLKSKAGGKRPKLQLDGHEQVEVWRLLSSLEWLDIPTKIWLGNQAVDRIEKKGLRTEKSAPLWAMSRLGARVPAYAAENQVVPVAQVEGWIRSLLAAEGGRVLQSFALMQMARKTDDRFRDIGDGLRAEVLDWLEAADKSHYAELVRARGQLGSEEQSQVFGDQLPSGLSLQSERSHEPLLGPQALPDSSTI